MSAIYDDTGLEGFWGELYQITAMVGVVFSAIPIVALGMLLLGVLPPVAAWVVAVILYLTILVVICGFFALMALRDERNR